MHLDCEVLIIGGGPAGCAVARACSKNGLNTVLIEEDKSIGTPVKCAEAIGAYLLPRIPFEIPESLFKWKIHGMYFWANDVAIYKEGGMWAGYSINRSEWDTWLSKLAQNNGTKILTNTRAISFEYDEKNHVTTVIATQDKEKISISPKYVVSATGATSNIFDILGIKKQNSLGYVKSFELNNLSMKYPKYEQLFFGEFAPKAYGYIFPLSKNTANVGVGTLHKKHKLDEFFEKFLSIPIVKNQLRNAKYGIEKSGEAPIKSISPKLVIGNVFLVGDAANQNIKPFIEGNLPGIICGDILGNFIFDLTQGVEKPQNYQKIIETKFSLIEESQVYADLVYGEHTYDQRTFDLILLGLMSELIQPEVNQIKSFIEKGESFTKKYLVDNGCFIEEKI